MRIGKFLVDLLVLNDKIVQDLLHSMKIVTIEHYPTGVNDRRWVAITAIFGEFDEVKEGHHIPEYRFTFHRNLDGTVERLHAEKNGYLL